MPPQRHDLTATGPSTASDPARLLNPKRTTDVLPKPDNCKSYRQAQSKQRKALTIAADEDKVIKYRHNQ